MGKIDELLMLKSFLRETADSYSSDVVSVGDYTYGVPEIHSWNNATHLTIGKFCSIADNVTIELGGEHRTDWISTYPFNAIIPSFSYIEGHPHTKGDIVIGNDVWIASGAKIMSGVTIGDGAVIAANALVTKDVEPYTIVGGVPAKVIGKRFDDEIVELLLQYKWWDMSEDMLAVLIPYLQSGDVMGFLAILDELSQ